MPFVCDVRSLWTEAPTNFVLNRVKTVLWEIVVRVHKPKILLEIIKLKSCLLR